MSDSGFSKELFAQFARIGSVLSTPARVELIYLLTQGEKTVEQLAGAAGLSHANASHHLQRLKGARLVSSRKRGKHAVYGLASPVVGDLWQVLQRIGEDRLLEVKELIELTLGGRDGLEPVTREELLRRIARDEVVVLDVRPEEEYRMGHLPTATSVPLERLEARLHSLPRDRVIVAYCRGPYCLISYDAVELLRASGFDALRLEDGFPEWKANDLPVELGEKQWARA